MPLSLLLEIIGFEVLTKRKKEAIGEKRKTILNKR
mgnify:CR=1 FL=1